jgi:PAS domain S-box-containing protein
LPTIRPDLLPLPKSRFLVHNVEINIRVATVRLERLRKQLFKESRHLIKESPEASDLQMPEGRSVNVNAPQPAKEALHPSEQDCRLIVDSIPGHVVTLTAHGDIEFVNQQWLDYLGKTLDELKSWTNCGVVHLDDLFRVVTTWNRSVETGQPYDSECRFCRADGVFRWFHVRAIPEREAEGLIVRWYCLHTDIDERKQAENRLQLLLDVTNQVVSNLQIDDLVWSKNSNELKKRNLQLSTGSLRIGFSG